jgi:A/G-specific adenine glycosylase
MEREKTANMLFDWYKINQRDLPWRKTRDAYLIWVSEIILQQTRIEQGTPYYLKFKNRFPNVVDLANASIEDVLLVWQGLGYYSRARNMHFAANQVVNTFDSVFPTSYQNLIQLKGIGKYTAAAISSITSSEKRPTVDGNVIRFISRLCGIDEPVDKLSTIHKIEKIASELIEDYDSGLQNQAMMEFGALVCVPQNPICSDCVFVPFCNAFAMQKQSIIPIKQLKNKSIKRYFNYLYITDKNQRILIYQRATLDIWQGLFELPLIEKLNLSPIELSTFLGVDVLIIDSIPIIKHQLSHQQIHTMAWLIECSPSQFDKIAISNNFLPINKNDISKFPISKLTDIVLSTISKFQ